MSGWHVEAAAAASEAPRRTIDAWSDRTISVLGDQRDSLLTALERELARWTLRRAANRHNCDGICDAPEHGRDVAELTQMLDILGLLDDQEQEQPEPAPVKQKAAAKRLAVAVGRRPMFDNPPCATVHPDLHFPVKSCGPDFELQAHEAKKVCRSCPFIRECLQGALDRNEAHGIWGGLTFKERKTLKRRIQRGRAA